MRIFAAGLSTETNTFSPFCTALEDFHIQRRKARGDTTPADALPEPFASWQRQAQARGDDFLFGITAAAQPSGITLQSAYEALRDELLHELRSAMPVDAVLLLLHGAMVAQGYDDCEADLVARVRDLVGPEVAIGVELDLHCHLSPAKISCADVVVIYKEYPHVDIVERARELFDLTIATRLGRIRPRMALFDCHMAGIYPTSRQPMRGFVDAMIEAERRDRILSLSFGHGYQFADLPHVGAKMLVIADDDAALAEQTAKEFGTRVYALRQLIGFDQLSLPLDQALRRAMASSKFPVVVADQSDNSGGGAPGDSTFALSWLLAAAAQDVAIAILYDPQVVTAARKAGPGAKLQVRLGGKLGPTSGNPIDIEVIVLSVLAGYQHAFPQQAAAPIMFPAGDVVALRCGTIDIVVSSERCQCFAPTIFSDLGIDPQRKKLLIVKSSQHFYGAFAPLAAEVIYMAAPGAVAPDPRQIEYRHLDVRQMYPWHPDPLAHQGNA
jgi:microcystin degradation protein MlrC